MEVHVSVIIVNYNVAALLEQALRSVFRAAEGLNVEVFVVDNASSDDSVERVRTLFPDVHLIANPDNVGFGKANNQAIRQARGAYLLILNPDTLLQEDSLRALVAFMERTPQCGAVGPTILNPDGTRAPESRRAFPSPETAFYRISGLSRLFPKHPRFGRYNLSFLPWDEAAEVDALSGSCMCVRRAALYFPHPAPQPIPPEPWAEPPADTVHPGSGAGLFDEAFFMYGEDLDWCYRIQQAGWQIWWTPDTHILHYKGESTRKGEFRYVRLFYGAMLQFAEKHTGGRMGGRFLQAGLRIAIVARAAVSVLAQWGSRLKGPLVDGALGAMALLMALFVRFGWDTSRYSLAFASSVGVLFVASLLLGILLAGGYQRRAWARLRSAWVGPLAGVMAVATVSFFVPEMAYSRAVLGLGGVVAMGLLGSARAIVRVAKRPAGNALFVGPPAEAERLRALLTTQPAPPFSLIGYVGPRKAGSAVPHLGAQRALRELVRWHRADLVVFAAEALPAHRIMTWMQRLQDLPVDFRMFGQHTVIGKHTIDRLPLAEAEAVLGPVPSPGWRTLSQASVAALLLVLAPVWLAGRRWVPACDVLASRLPALLRVMVGEAALIGPPDPESARIAPHRTGLFPLPAAQDLAPSAKTHLYATYLHQQSMGLDLRLLLRALRNRA